jgi:hypothetical protein
MPIIHIYHICIIGIILFAKENYYE